MVGDGAGRGNGLGALDNCPGYCRTCIRHSFRRNRIGVGTRSWPWLEGSGHQIAGGGCPKGFRRKGRRTIPSHVGLGRRRTIVWLAAQPSDVRRLGLTPEIPVVLFGKAAIASQKCRRSAWASFFGQKSNPSR